MQFKSKEKFLLSTVRTTPSIARFMLVHEHMLFLFLLLSHLPLDIVLFSKNALRGANGIRELLTTPDMRRWAMLELD
jgi:hypothetical protein